MIFGKVDENGRTGEPVRQMQPEVQPR
jgi:hypothetical protein